MFSSAVPGLGPSGWTQVRAPQLSWRPAAVSVSCRSLRLLSMYIALISFLSIVSAQNFGFEAAADNTALFRQLESKGQILCDQRDPPPVPTALLHRRQDNVGSPSSTSPSPTSTASSDPSTATLVSSTAATSSVSNSSFASDSPTSVTSLSPTATGTNPSGTAMAAPIPSPFDSSLGSNFTSQACPDFFKSFLSNSTFRSCVPVSLLLQNSKSFFSAARSPVLLEETLNLACNAPLPICQPLMASLASQLVSSSHCGADYQAQNPLVSQAHAGLLAYQAVYQTTCLKSNDTSNYCYADAIANQLNPSDAFPYYVAVGLNLPPGSHPTCNNCLQATMSILAGYAKDENQPLAATYMQTARGIDQNCGPQFANTAVPVGTMSSSTSGADRTCSASLAATIVAIALALCLV